MDDKHGSRFLVSISDKCCGNAHLGRQHLQRQTTLVVLAAQKGGNQSVHVAIVTRYNSSYGRVN